MFAWTERMRMAWWNDADMDEQGMCVCFRTVPAVFVLAHCHVYNGSSMGTVISDVIQSTDVFEEIIIAVWSFYEVL